MVFYHRKDFSGFFRGCFYHWEDFSGFLNNDSFTCRILSKSFYCDGRIFQDHIWNRIFIKGFSGFFQKLLQILSVLIFSGSFSAILSIFHFPFSSELFKSNCQHFSGFFRIFVIDPSNVSIPMTKKPNNLNFSNEIVLRTLTIPTKTTWNCSQDFSGSFRIFVIDSSNVSISMVKKKTI